MLTPAPLPTETPFACGMPAGPLVYTGCSAAACAASTGSTLGREALCVPWAPSPRPGYALGCAELDSTHMAAPRALKPIKECGFKPSRATYHRLPVLAGTRGAVR